MLDSLRTVLVVVAIVSAVALVARALVRWNRADRYRDRAANRKTQGATAEAVQTLEQEANYEKDRAVRTVLVATGTLLIVGGVGWLVPTLVGSILS